MLSRRGRLAVVKRRGIAHEGQQEVGRSYVSRRRVLVVSHALQLNPQIVQPGALASRVQLHARRVLGQEERLPEELEREFGIQLPIVKWLESDSELHEETVRQKIEDEINAAYQKKTNDVGEPVIRHLEKAVMLQVLDTQWKDHLAAMDHLRQGIHLRGYAQKNPKQEYKRESFEMFTAMRDRVKQEVITILSRIEIRAESEVDSFESQRRSQQTMEYLHPSASDAIPEQEMSEGMVNAEAETETSQPYVRETPKVGRNDPCPCGSGKKYKRCHGQLG